MRLKPAGVLLLAVLAAGSVVAWVATGPVRTVGRIQGAMAAGDTAQLARDVDFPQLRANLKTRISKEIAKTAQVDGTPAGIGIELLGGALMGKIVETIVTPEWLVGATLAAGQAGAKREEVAQRLEGERSLSVNSPSRAHLSYGDDEGRLVLIMERRGLDWVVVDVDADRPKNQ